MNQVDLYLTNKNFDITQNEVDYVDTWKEMEKCVELGLTRSIGVSNFNSKQLARLFEAAKIKPVMNQVEVHVNFNQKKLIEFCANLKVAVTAFSPLGSPGHDTPFQPAGREIGLKAPEITEIAKKYNKTNAQVALRYLVRCQFIIKCNNIVFD